MILNLPTLTTVVAAALSAAYGRPRLVKDQETSHGTTSKNDEKVDNKIAMTKDRKPQGTHWINHMK